jgi:N-acetylglutamate synthase-like GNAT family acetyltransferase
MKHTGEADALITELMAHARKEHLSKLYSTKYEEKESRKRMTYSSTSQTNTPTHNHANSFNTCCKFITIYRIQQKEYSSA